MITDNEKGLVVRIHVFDQESIRILGNNSIEFVGLNGYKSVAQWQHYEAQELLNAIYNAILDQLNKKQSP